MRHPLLVKLATLGLLLCALAQAQKGVSWLDKSIGAHYNYLKALDAVKKAEATTVALKDDVLATGLEREAAKAQLADAKTNVVSTALSLRKQHMQAYFNWLESQDDLELQRSSLAMAELAFKAAKVKFKIGSINALELAKAETQHAAALQGTKDAQLWANNAQQTLKVLLKTLPTQGLEATPTPKKATLQQALEGHPQVVRAQNTLAKAQLDDALTDNVFSSSVTIQQAKDAVQDAQNTLQDTTKQVTDNFERSWEALESATDVLVASNRVWEVAQKEQQAQSLRFKKGLIAKITLMDSELSLDKAKAALKKAQHKYTLAVVDVAIAANVDIWSSAKL